MTNRNQLDNTQDFADTRVMPGPQNRPWKPLRTVPNLGWKNPVWQPQLKGPAKDSFGVKASRGELITGRPRRFEYETQDWEGYIYEKNALIDDPDINEANRILSQWDEEHDAYEAFYSAAAQIAERVLNKLSSMEEADGKNRARMDNASAMAKQREELIYQLHHKADEIIGHQRLMRISQNKSWKSLAQHHQAEAQKRVLFLLGLKKRCEELFRNKKALQKTGHSYTGMAAVYNEVLYLLKFVGVKVNLNLLKSYNGEEIVHKFSHENRRPDMSRDDWNYHIMAEMYSQDDTPEIDEDME